ncbi:MAG: hypothetical protein OSA99_13580 [Acidimicrobiales bacterium]|nr:hypothetical protein [Acidimicrobiales bacterium]
MITTSSKFFYALAGLLLVTGVVYGYTTGGGEVGPISLGYKGAVGDLLGYSILMGSAFVSAFVGFSTTAFRDGDPEAAAEILGADHAPVPVAPQTSYWPLVGAFGLGFVVVGIAVNNVFFVAGLIALGAVAIEWTIQAWSERATGDPAVNREIRNRLMLPIEVPIAGALAIAIIVVGFSRLFLTISKENAVWAALVAAALVFVVGTVLSTRPALRKDMVAGLLAVGAVATIGIGIVSAVQGEREFHHVGDEDSEHSDDAESHDDDAESHEDGAEEPAEEHN